MYRVEKKSLKADMQRNVAAAVREDVGSGDITSELVPGDCIGKAVIIAKEEAVVCGAGWVDEVFCQIDPKVKIDWCVTDGDRVEVGQEICHIAGNARSLLTGERTALNYLQTLSGTATRSRFFLQID